MPERPNTLEEAIAEIEDLRARLQEAEETLGAIRTGQVDAVVVAGPEGEQVYTLSGAERTYRILVEAMNEGALVLSPEGVVIYCNRTFAAMLGAAVYDVLGHTIYEFVAAADVEPLRKMLAQASISVSRREITLRRAEEGSVPAFVSVGNLETGEGDAISAVVTDLTEHKRTEAELQKYREHLEDLVMARTRELQEEIEERRAAEEALRQARDEAERHAAELHSFFASMSDGVVLHDADGKAVLANDAARRLLGPSYLGSVEDRVKRFAARHLDGPPMKPEETATGRALRGEMVRDQRYRLTSHDGQEIVISAGSSPVRAPDGRVVGAATVFRDVTDLVEFERRQQELYQREHHIAEMLQQALIPSDLPGVLRQISIAAKYQPALREAEVGGDFYDVFELDEDRVAVLIGDVAGKGLQAAIRVAAARYAFRSYAYVEPRPSRVMTLVNDALCREGSVADNALTAFFAVVNTYDGTMTYVSAGHEPPVVCNDREGVEELEVTGAMIGIIPGARYYERTRSLREGDSVVMFTDGITEARRPNAGMFDKTGVIEHLTKACDAQPEEIAEALLEAAALHAGGNLQDDAAIVVLGFEKGR